MQNICGRTSSKEACHACMVGHADTLMSAPQTGSYYNCAGTDLVKFCNDKPSATGGNSSGCLPKPGLPSAYEVLCAARDDDVLCEADLFDTVCYWKKPPGPVTPKCLPGLALACGRGELRRSST